MKYLVDVNNIFKVLGINVVDFDLVFFSEFLWNNKFDIYKISVFFNVFVGDKFGYV